MRINLSRVNAEKLASKLSNQIRGTGESKREDRAQSDKVGRNGKTKAEKIHSKSELKAFKSVAAQYFKEVKAEHGTLKGNINTETATKFIENKLEKGEWKGSTANTHIHHFQNIEIAFKASGLKADIDTKKVEEVLKTNGHDLSKNHENRAYSDSGAIVETMRNTNYAVTAILQHEAGLRVDDATDSSKWTINNNNTITIEGSKGGVDYTTAPLSNETIQMATQAKENGYTASYTSYRVELKEAVEANGEKWNGTHGLRYSFAQERLEDLKNTHTEKEALGIISLEMGHSREEITNHYL